MIYDIFKDKKCFKLICGAGNEDCEEVEKLVALYSSAGCQLFDLCANEKVIDAAKQGLKRSGFSENRYLCISVGSESDQHFCKAQIEQSKCSTCGMCEKICGQNAIYKNNDKFEVNNIKCIGCKKCIDCCQNNCISLVTHKTDLKTLLPDLIKKGLDCIEFHVAGDETDIIERWQDINNIFDGALGISINRSKAADEKIIYIVKEMISIRKPYTTIIQADGVPMSGGKDDYNSTLQAIATADMFKSKNLPAFVIASGGTNSKTSDLAKICNVELDGIAIGSYARKIVKEYTSQKDFFENPKTFNDALVIAKSLVNSI